MYKILSDIKYDGKIFLEGDKSDLKKLKSTEIEKLMYNKIIGTVIAESPKLAKAKDEPER